MTEETFKGDLYLQAKPIKSIIGSKVDPELFTSLEDILRYIRWNFNEESLPLQRGIENTIKEGYNIDKVNFIKD